MRVRLPVAVAVHVALGIAPAARADPQLEGSGFLGVDWFGKRSALGNSSAPEQVPGTSPVIGGRIGWLVAPALSGDLQLALEAEFAFAPAFTGSDAGHGRMAYFAPVFEWRGQAALRLSRWRGMMPHLVLGAGGDSVSSRSPFMADDSEPIAYWGLGLVTPTSGGWQLRLDLRQGVMPARNGGALFTAELEFGIGATLGSPDPVPRRSPASAAAVAAGEPERDREPGRDRDGDGIPDRLDACPGQPGDGTADGCPAPDPDGDGITGDADQCPDQPEDKDGFQDADGCPDPDNDGDGIDDAHDACPDRAETVNGWQDEDGCPDEVPAEVAAALGTAIRFEPGHARVTEPAGATLRVWFAVLDRHPELRLVIIGHAERAGGDDLARRRAEAVKWYLIDLGIAEDRITARVGPVPGAPAITFQLAPRGP